MSGADIAQTKIEPTSNSLQQKSVQVIYICPEDSTTINKMNKTIEILL
jgi:hypothetical protein